MNKHNLKRRASGTNRWPAQQAKSRFSELIRRAQHEGPQIVTLHGRDAVTVTAIEVAEDIRTGQVLIDAMRKCPVKDFDFEGPKFYGAFRDIDL